MLKNIRRLLKTFHDLPYLGRKTAERVVFSLLEADESKLRVLRDLISELSEKRTVCEVCNVASSSSVCDVCADAAREKILCIVENSKEYYKIELAGIFSGKYHVLGGLISPFQSKTFGELNTSNIRERIEKEGIKEVMIALSPLPEGDITASYIIDLLKGCDVEITKTAVGVPSGIFMENADEITLKNAITGRVRVKK